MIDPPGNGQSAPGDGGDGSQPSSRKRVRIAHTRPNFDESPQPETRNRSTPITKSIDTPADAAAPVQEDQRPAEEPARPSRSGEAGPRSAPVIIRPEVHQGSHPGDKFIRYGRTAGPFKRKGRDVYAASLEANAPRSKWGQIFDRFKRVTIGRPISTEHSIHERLSNVKALAVL